MKRKRIMVGVLLAAVLCVIAGGAFVFYSYSTRVYKHCMAEAGTEVVAEDFLKDPSFDIAFTEDSAQIDTAVPGDYKVKLRSGLFTYTCTLTIQDTVAPAAEVREVVSGHNEAVEAGDFVVSAEDETEVFFSYVQEPDFGAYGAHDVQIRIADLGGNETICDTVLVISPVRERVEVEAGNNLPTLRDFMLTDEFSDAKIVSGMEDIPMDTVGEHEISITAGGFTYSSCLAVVDTIPPILQVQDVSAYTTSELKVEDFVVLAQDTTAIVCSFATEPDMTAVGTQTVTVQACDEGGNTVVADARLTLAEDTEAPVFTGVRDQVVYIGDSISYKTGVQVTDNCDPDMSFSVDNSRVDLNTEGVYPVTYSAVDRAGNEAAVTIQVTVHKRAYSIEEVDALADKVLAGIITDDMSEYDKLTAIYKWVRRNVGYIGHSDKGDWVKAAYEGLAMGQGDCYVFACVAKELLTRAGIENRDIAKIPAKTEHYWNLVNIGEGWYHYDTCPRKDRAVFCYVTDAELMEYSNSHNGTHNYDSTIYTDIQ